MPDLYLLLLFFACVPQVQNRDGTLNAFIAAEVEKEEAATEAATAAAAASMTGEGVTRWTRLHIGVQCPVFCVSGVCPVIVVSMRSVLSLGRIDTCMKVVTTAVCLVVHCRLSNLPDLISSKHMCRTIVIAAAIKPIVLSA